MDSPPKLSGETLVVHHIPLVHCQVSGGWKGGCGSSLKRSTPFSSPENLGLSRTTSLPERDVLQREALLYSSLIQTSSGSLSSHNRGREKKGSERGGSTASDDSSFASSNSEDQLTTAHTLPRTKPRRRNPLRHNPFLLNTENNDEDDEEEDGDNLSGYLEDSSFHLHSDTNSVLDDRVVPFHLHSGFASEPFILHSSVRRGSRESLRGPTSDLSNHLDDLDMLGLDSQCRHGSSGSNMSMDCGEQDWGDDDEEDQPMKCGRNSKTGSYSSSSSIQHCSCCGLSQSYPQHFPEAFPEPFLEFQQGYGSDSSCNSSDGVLVNFSAIYNKMNNSIPEKQPAPGPTNLNSSTDHSSISYISDNPGHKDDSAGGAFYLDIQTSPTEPPRSQQQPSCLSNNFPLILEPHLTTSSTCSCSAEHQGTFGLDANCNSFHPPHEGSSGDLASCLQSQARLVVATQNYYKLVTCDLSSQSSPSPVGSSVNSCSDEHSKGSPTPSQPSEYFLFRQQDDEMGLKEELEQEGEVGESSRQDDDDNKEDKEGKKSNQEAIGGAETAPAMIEGQVYVNVSPPLAGKGVIGDGASSGSRPRSRSYDRNLDKSPSPRLGSLERMLSCPVRLSEGAAQVPTPPPRVTSFAEIARSKRRIGATGGSPLQKSAADPFSSTYSTHSHSSVDFSPIPEQCVEVVSPAMSPIPFTRCYSQGDIERQLEGARETQDTWEKAEGGLSSSSDSRPAVVRYSKDQRPTTLPIQPFTFQHQFTSRPAQAKPLLPLLTGYHSGMQVHTSSSSGGPFGDDTAGNGHNNQGSLSTAAPPMELVRPSPLGSYSPVHFQGAHSSETCTPNPQCTHRPSCPLSAGLDPLHTPLTGKKGGGSAPLTQTPPSLGVKRGVVPPMLPTVQGQCLHHGPLYSLPALHSDSLSPLGLDSGKTPEGGKGSGARTQNAHHLSPQALKWREYRRRNPLGGERVSGGHSSAGSGPVSGNTELRRSKGARPTRRNVFDFPAAHSSHMMGHLTGGQSAKLQQSCSDFLHDYFSMTEKPPEEFCLSPDASSSSSCSPSQPQVSVDLMQKRGLVKAVNTAVDLIVAHFGTSRVPNVKAKLGNSWVSPNVGHLILKYLCPALHDVLQDGLKAFVLDLIIGQRRCLPWNLVEASTQLGPSTRHLHSLFSKVSQYSELTSHSMRLNAFIFGLLNLKSLEFWFNHLYTHEDIVAAHYSPWGFLPLSHGACQTLFEELLLLLQPLSLLPFDLDLLFEPHLLQKGEEHLRHKEQLCSAGQSVDQASRSTFQLMRGWSTTVSGMVRDSRVEAKRERAGLRREGTWPRMEGSGSRNEAAGVKLRVKVTPVSRSAAMENGSPSLWRGRESESQRIKGVGQESNGDNEGVKEKDSRMGKEREPACEGRQHQDRQAGWWYQLMQSSQVYIDQSTEGSKFVKTEKRKRSSERRQGQAPPAREGVVEGAESRHEGEGEKSSTSGGDSAGCGGRPSWMGSPPQSVLNQEKDTNPLEVSEMAAQAAVQEESPPQGQSLRWGRLFGSSVGIPLRVEGAEQKPKSQKTRPPSGWLGLDKSVLELMALTIGGGGKKTERPDTPTHTQTTTDPVSSHQAETQQSVCEVRALCHHIATEPDQLSFNKGDILQVLRKADPDWLLCSLGSTRGLVPIVYVTLNSMEDSQDATGLMQL